MYLFCFYLTIHVLGFGYFLFLSVGWLFCAGAGNVLWAEVQESANSLRILRITPAEGQAEPSAVKWGCTVGLPPGHGLGGDSITAGLVSEPPV